MFTLSREHRRMLENTVAKARIVAEEGARKVLRDQYAVDHHEPWPHMTADDRKLRNQLRAHGRQLGDERDPKRETQEIKHLAQACAYEHWHRMLFARFLAENNLLLDAQHGVAMTLDDIRELAREQVRDWMEVAAELAQRMLLAVFRPDDPVLKIRLLPETRQDLEEKLASLPREVFQADDSLGWVYQFWQRDEKDRVNESEVKIGADELPAVTQLFTEDYMVLFLLENTLGAWWTAKRRAQGKNPNLRGYAWTYLRLNEDGSPAAGPFDGWPRSTRELRLLDPCMGSGHFLVFALQILARMRMEEEGLSIKEALASVFKENLFGLEIDPRCSQIAAFNLALAAWRLAQEHFDLPEMNIACSGLGIHSSEATWVKLANGEPKATLSMRKLYEQFQGAPVLGSLINPSLANQTLIDAEFTEIQPLLERVLKEPGGIDNRELAISAKGLLDAAKILSRSFTLVITNYPFVGYKRQDSSLRTFADRFHPRSKADLATMLFERSLFFLTKGGTRAAVLPQNWTNLGSYTEFRRDVLRTCKVEFLIRLGPGAFASIGGHVVKPVLIAASSESPKKDHTFWSLDTQAIAGTEAKAETLRSGSGQLLNQSNQMSNPDSRIVFGEASNDQLLENSAFCPRGIVNGDGERWIARIWELPNISNLWRPLVSAPAETEPFTGRSLLINWSTEGDGMLRPSHGNEAFGKYGVAVSRMTDLKATLYCGEMYDQNVAPIIPLEKGDLPALWAFCRSPEFANSVRRLDQKVGITPATLVKVSFDKEHWRQIASTTSALPTPASSDHTQWLFTGHPKGSKNPLQVAVARMLGYRWPRQTGSSFPECPSVGPDELEKHADTEGIVPLNAIAGQASAADRVRALLAEAYGHAWSAAKLKDLLGDWNSLEEWLRDQFFYEHCQVFDQRPFVWHIWDGRKDGFHALVNYHKLAAPNGVGRNTLEKLIYTYLGRWTERQMDEVKSGKEGADARLTSATHLKTELEKILAGQRPHDIFVRWKPLRKQPIGWEPDINDGVRLNIRPWLTAKVHETSRRDGCILRVTPRIPYGKDRGKELDRPKHDFPWFWAWDGHSDDFMGGDEFDGARWNDLHYSLVKKKEARERHK